MMKLNLRRTSTENTTCVVMASCKCPLGEVTSCEAFELLKDKTVIWRPVRIRVLDIASHLQDMSFNLMAYEKDVEWNSVLFGTIFGASVIHWYVIALVY